MIETPAPAGRFSGWRLLGAFWALALALLLGGGVVLLALGPPPEPVAVAAEEPQAPHAAPTPPEPVSAREPLPLPLPVAGPPPPRIAFARPAPPEDGRPRVALVAGGLGLSAEVTARAIRSLPVAVGLAFSPHAEEPGPQLQQARLRGFETLLALPLEPIGFPLNDPGPGALLTGLPRTENARRLEALLLRQGGHVGAVGALGPLRGERFAALPDLFDALQRQLQAAGMLYIDPRPGEGPPRHVWGRGVDVVLDSPPSRAEIELRLTQLERAAHERGAALGYLGEVSPVAVERVAAWAAGLAARGLVLVPPSALALPPRPEN